jgi:hypothetical protein
VVVGKVTEHIAPYFPEFRYNPRDARFLGSPVDLVVFDGLDAGSVKQVVFVEIKSGTGSLSQREKQVRDAVTRGSVKWEEIRATIEASPRNSGRGLADLGEVTPSPAIRVSLTRRLGRDRQFSRGSNRRPSHTTTWHPAPTTRESGSGVWLVGCRWSFLHRSRCAPFAGRRTSSGPTYRSKT